MNRFLTLLVLICFTVISVAPAQSTDDKKSKADEITADRVLERFIEATGGRKAYEKLTSRVIKGTLEVAAQGIKGTIEIYSKAPDKHWEVGVIEGIGEFTRAYDGQIGWSQDPINGLRELSGVELAILKRSATFNGELKWRQLYPKVELVGKEKINEKEVYVVRLTPTEGQPVTSYYDTASFLVVRTDMVQEGPQGNVPIESYVSDYREVNGIKIPFEIKQSIPIGTLLIKLTEVKHNLPIDDARFRKPSSTVK